MVTLYNKYLSLREKDSSNDDTIFVDKIPGVSNHKIGVSKNGQPMFFISTKEKNKTKLPLDLKLIQVEFNKHCELIYKSNKKETGTYTIIKLKSESKEITKYFISNVLHIIKNLGSEPSFDQIKNELNKLASLFQVLLKKPKKTIQGLWAELLIIEQSKDPSYLINCWHQKKSDLYDFNNGFDKLEVKSTSKSKRVHKFSLNQLQEIKDSLILVGSIFTIETDKGINAETLIEKIQERLNSPEEVSKLQNVVADTMGIQIERIYDTFFDYTHALNSIKLFNVIDVPKILNDSVPQEISNVKFNSDLSGIRELTDSDFNSDLLNSIR